MTDFCIGTGEAPSKPPNPVIGAAIGAQNSAVGGGAANESVVEQRELSRQRQVQGPSNLPHANIE